jgi:ankyrin repeat protein
VYEQAVRPLHIACDVGTMGSIRTLLRKGVAVDVFNERGISPLELCIDKERADCVDALLRAGAHPDTVGARSDLGSPLLRAVRKKNRRIVGMLLDSKASLAKNDEENGTALMVAACFSDPEMIKYLLDRGADPSVKDDDGHDASHYASSCHNKANAAFFRKQSKAKRTRTGE